MKRLLTALGVVVGLVVAALIITKLRYGGGEPFPDLGTPPVLASSDVEVAASLPFPPGCVTLAPDGRVFFDTRPFAAPARFGEPHVFELVDGKAYPWPGEEAQEIFVAPFGITADADGRLWITEPATLDRSATRLLGFDLASRELIFELTLPDGDARFAQDLRVSPDGRYLVLADTGAFDFTPGQLIVVEIATKKVLRTLRHESFNPQDWFIERFDGEAHRVGWGLLSFKVGIDGISFSPDGEWLYYGSMSHDTLYRLPSALLFDPEAEDAEIYAAIEAVGPKPQSDGIATAPDGRILLTDVENGGIAELTPDGELRTLTASTDVVWADSVAVGADGSVWFTDSAIPTYLQQSMLPPARSALEAAGPYEIHRFQLPSPSPGPKGDALANPLRNTN